MKSAQKFYSSLVAVLAFCVVLRLGADLIGPLIPTLIGLVLTAAALVVLLRRK